jgi:hypothetical protein
MSGNQPVDTCFVINGLAAIMMIATVSTFPATIFNRHGKPIRPAGIDLGHHGSRRTVCITIVLPRPEIDAAPEGGECVRTYFSVSRSVLTNTGSRFSQYL